MVKKIIFTLYILVLLSMAVATIVEKSQGTDYVHAHYYGAWWFILMVAKGKPLSIRSARYCTLEGSELPPLTC